MKNKSSSKKQFNLSFQSNQNYSEEKTVQNYLNQIQIKEKYQNNFPSNPNLQNGTKCLNIKLLCLGFTNLISIENLPSLGLLNLSLLSLQSNQISSIQPLRKLHSPLLFALNLYDNNIKELNSLSELSGINIRIMNIQVSSKSKQQDQTFNWIFKSNFNNLYNLRLWSDSRISSVKLKEMKNKKFKKLITQF